MDSKKTKITGYSLNFERYFVDRMDRIEKTSYFVQGIPIVRAYRFTSEGNVLSFMSFDIKNDITV